jgi:DNA-binding NarL/FixJ family response regulator
LAFIKGKIPILLVDDHTMILEGVSRVINESKDFEVIATAKSVSEALELLKHNTFSIAVTDYNLPDQTGLELIRQCRNLYPQMNIIVLSMYDEAHLIREVLKEGVQGYILKKDSLSELEKALSSVLDNETYVSKELHFILEKNPQSESSSPLLTKREKQILLLILSELSNKQISEKLFISERTVETHRKNIFRKTDTHNLIGLTKFAYSAKIIL